MKYSEQEILMVLDAVSKAVKDYDHGGEFTPNKRNGKKTMYPEYYSGYNAVVMQWKDNLVHAEIGTFADRLLGKKAPNQSQEEFDYLKGIYEQLTLPVFVDYSNSIKRAFNDGNWSIEYPEQKDPRFKDANSLKEYLTKELKEFGSIANFMRSFFIDIQAKDANGGIAVFDSKLDLVRDEEGKIAVAEKSDEARKPLPHYYNCSQVVKFSEGEWYLVECTEKTMVEYGGGKKRIGRVYWWFDKEMIYKCVQVGKFVDYTFEVIPYLQHETGEIPFKRNGGVPRLHDNKVIYDSVFSFAVGLLNLVIVNGNYLQACVNNCVYPQRVMLGDECDFEENGARCFEGNIINPANPLDRHKCQKCMGTGLKTRVGALGTIFLRKAANGQPEAKASDIIHFASPSTETLKFLMEKVEKDETKARNILHLYTSTTEVKGAENPTATQSGIDQKTHYAFIKPISDSVFSMFRFIVDMIGKMREGEAYQQINITSPITFDFYTEEDYLEQLKAAREAGLPPYVLYIIMWKFINALYHTEKKTAEVFNLVMDSDRIATLTNQEVSNGFLNGTIELWEKVLHESAVTFVNELILANPKYLSLDYSVKKEQLIEKAKAKAEELEEEREEKNPADEL